MKVVICLPTVVARENESFDILLKRFKKKCEKAAILSEIKKNQAYEKPSVRKKREANIASRKMLKMQRRMQRYLK
ncbi:MAG TPA: 30S ribosomal protein S21 [Candidatus Cloacimonas sp.]|nr:MAG: 30S ribosomal protein S21 [Candidatus Cloacimonetes bacterium ADurb.Bin089]HPA24214.1 30S ribosomal protein S21 [Candidatus Cloacimonas sp.]